jgi:hypothetical protein
MSERTVHCADAIEWLKSQDSLIGCSLIASLPDISEFQGYSLSRWKEWFLETSTLILSKCPDDGVTVFYQSDIKHEGSWVDKGYLCQKAAEAAGMETLWHKIVCRYPPGTITFGRPAFSHMLCFSKGIRVDVSKSTMDVLPDIGDKTWERGMGMEACLLASKFILTQTNTRTIVHPFCGEGSMLAAANSMGLNAVGIDRSPKRTEKARTLKLILESKKWEI